MKPRTLLILLALVVGLGAFVWFWERQQPGSEDREKLAKRVLDVKREDIVGLELRAGDRVTSLVRTQKAGETDQKAGKDAVSPSDPSGASGAGAKATGAKDQDHWRLRQPIDFPADYWSVDALVRSLAELDRVRELDSYDAKEVGLDQPRGHVIVELAGGRKKDLRIGAEVPGSSNMIVAVEGEKGASVIASTIWESVTKNAAEWRDKDLFAPEREDVAEMTLEHLTEAAASPPGGAPVTVRLTKAEGEDFDLTEPIRDRADADAVNALLRELTGMRASAFLDSPPPLASIGLEPPRARLTVKLKEGEPFVLLWGARKEGASAQESYAKVGELVVTTTAALDEALERAPADWRSKAWSSMPVFEIDQVSATDAKGTLAVTRDEGSWRRGDDAIDYGPVSDFLYAVSDAKAERIAAAGEVAALGQPEVTLVFAAVDEGEKGTGAVKEKSATKPTPSAASPAGGATPTAAAGGAASSASNAAASALKITRTERLELFAPDASNLVPARVEGRDAILLLKRETRDQILAKLESVREAKPPTAEPTPGPKHDSPQD